MNSKRTLISLLALSAVAAPAVVAAPKPDLKLSIEADPKVVTFGEDLNVIGQLTGGTEREVSGQNVTLQADPFPYGGRFEKLQTVDTKEAGRYAFTVKPIM